MLCFRALMLLMAMALAACENGTSATTKWREKVYSGSVVERVSAPQQSYGDTVYNPVWLKSTDGYVGIGPSNGLGPGFGE